MSKNLSYAGYSAAQPFAGADLRFGRICLELSYYRGGKRAAPCKITRISGQKNMAYDSSKPVGGATKLSHCATHRKLSYRRVYK